MVNQGIVSFQSQETQDGVVESTAGVAVEVAEGRPQITLIEIAENVGERLMDNLPLACQAVRDEFFPDMSLEDIDWVARAGSIATDIAFKVSNGTPIEMTLSNGARMMHAYPKPLDDYATEGDSGAGLTSYERTFYIVLQPDSPNGQSIFESEFDAPHMRDSKIVGMLDARTFLEHWKRQAGFSEERAAELRAEGFTDTKSDMILLSSSQEESARHAVRQDANGNGITAMAEVKYDPNNAERPISIDNGRHRIFHAINLGAPYIPVVMDNTPESQAFIDRFSWNPHERSGSAMEMSVGAGI